VLGWEDDVGRRILRMEPSGRRYSLVHLAVVFLPGSALSQLCVWALLV
jgi:hypothetical protein